MNEMALQVVATRIRFYPKSPLAGQKSGRKHNDASPENAVSDPPRIRVQARGRGATPGARAIIRSRVTSDLRRAPGGTGPRGSPPVPCARTPATRGPLAADFGPSIQQQAPRRDEAKTAGSATSPRLPTSAPSPMPRFTPPVGFAWLSQGGVACHAARPPYRMTYGAAHAIVRGF